MWIWRCGEHDERERRKVASVLCFFLYIQRERDRERKKQKKKKKEEDEKARNRLLTEWAN